MKITTIFNAYKKCCCSNYCIDNIHIFTFMSSPGGLEISYKKEKAAVPWLQYFEERLQVQP